jgi:hypothetical protein
MELPVLPEGMRWRIHADSANPENEGRTAEDGILRMIPRSTVVLTGE